MDVNEQEMLHPLVLNLVLFFSPPNKVIRNRMNLSFVIIWVVITIFFSGFPLKALSKPNAYKRVEI